MGAAITIVRIKVAPFASVRHLESCVKFKLEKEKIKIYKAIKMKC